MTRALALVALLSFAAGCRSPAAPRPTPTPPPPASPGADTKPEPASPAPGGASPEPGGVSPVDPSPRPSWSSITDGSACERSCAELHECVTEQGELGAAAAASVELGCLEACVSSPTQGSLFGCELPSASVGPDRCAPFLACVREAWPEPGPDTPPSRVVEHRGPGCERACWAFARCEDKAQDPDVEHKVGLCTRQCSEVLDDAQERRAGECTTLADCHDIKRCVLALPGA